MLSDALDELDINGAISGVLPQKYDQDKISLKALQVKYNKKSSDPKSMEIWWRCWQTIRAITKKYVSKENYYHGPW